MWKVKKNRASRKFLPHSSPSLGMIRPQEVAHWVWYLVGWIRSPSWGPCARTPRPWYLVVWVT